MSVLSSAGSQELITMSNTELDTETGLKDMQRLATRNAVWISWISTLHFLFQNSWWFGDIRKHISQMVPGRSIGPYLVSLRLYKIHIKSKLTFSVGYRKEVQVIYWVWFFLVLTSKRKLLKIECTWISPGYHLKIWILLYEVHWHPRFCIFDKLPGDGHSDDFWAPL
jgi:hypothetical protein